MCNECWFLFWTMFIIMSFSIPHHNFIIQVPISNLHLSGLDWVESPTRVHKQWMHCLMCPDGGEFMFKSKTKNKKLGQQYKKSKVMTNENVAINCELLAAVIEQVWDERMGKLSTLFSFFLRVEWKTRMFGFQNELFALEPHHHTLQHEGEKRDVENKIKS